MILEVLLNQRPNTRIVDIAELGLGALDRSIVFAAGKRGHGK
jgi:hypothetical protein